MNCRNDLAIIFLHFEHSDCTVVVGINHLSVYKTSHQIHILKFAAGYYIHYISTESAYSADQQSNELFVNNVSYHI